jgi:hypothetical protein
MSLDLSKMLAEAEAEAATIEAEDRAAWRRMCTPSAEQEVVAARRWAEHDWKWRTPFFNPLLDAQDKVSEKKTGRERQQTLAKIAGSMLRSDVEPFAALELCQSWNLHSCAPPLAPDAVKATLDAIATRELARRRAVA